MARSADCLAVGEPAFGGKSALYEFDGSNPSPTILRSALRLMPAKPPFLSCKNSTLIGSPNLHASLGLRHDIQILR